MWRRHGAAYTLITLAISRLGSTTGIASTPVEDILLG
jgi:hypothetical protein